MLKFKVMGALQVNRAKTSDLLITSCQCDRPLTKSSFVIHGIIRFIRKRTEDFW